MIRIYCLTPRDLSAKPGCGVSNEPGLGRVRCCKEWATSMGDKSISDTDCSVWPNGGCVGGGGQSQDVPVCSGSLDRLTLQRGPLSEGCALALPTCMTTLAQLALGCPFCSSLPEPGFPVDIPPPIPHPIAVLSLPEALIFPFGQGGWLLLAPCLCGCHVLGRSRDQKEESLERREKRR